VHKAYIEDAHISERDGLELKVQLDVVFETDKEQSNSGNAAEE
jgi:hypothetical protein